MGKQAKTLSIIEAAKVTTLPRLLIGLGIRHVGSSAANLIAEAAGSLEGILTLEREDLEAIHDIGEKVADSMITWRDQPANQDHLKALGNAGLSAEVPEKRTDGGPLLGRTFVITGTLPSLSRKEAENLIKKNGGKPVGSISKKTSYLLAGEKAGSKLKKAEALGIPVIDEAGLQELIKQNNTE